MRSYLRPLLVSLLDPFSSAVLDIGEQFSEAGCLEQILQLVVHLRVAYHWKKPSVLEIAVLVFLDDGTGHPVEFYPQMLRILF